MRRAIHIVLVSLYVMQALSCKKDAQPQQQNQPQQQSHSLEKGLLNFTVNGELITAQIDTTENTILVAVPDTTNQHKLTVTLELASQVTATINNTSVGNNFTYDFTQPVTLTVTSADKQRSTSFSVTVENQMTFEGFTGALVAQKGLDKTYNYYLDQFDGSTYQSINCGPTSTTMAIKWADSTFTGTPAQIRTSIEPQGGLWYTGDVEEYLNLNHINYAADTLTNIDSLVKTNIDQNHVMILCLNMEGVTENSNQLQHVGKFYGSEVAGHFILIKGYRQTATNFYLEAYDPYSDNDYYTGYDFAQIKGKDRYYLDSQIAVSAGGWWPYVIIVAAKGQSTGTNHLMVRLRHKPMFEAAGR